MRAVRLLANLLRRCHECNFPLSQRELFCPRCGAKQRREKLAGMKGKYLPLQGEG